LVFENEILKNTYGGKLRLRVCGVCEIDGKVLLANHLEINGGNNFWCPPGGGVEFGETIEAALKREFFEETGLIVSIGKFLGIYEFINEPLHAVELFYEIFILGGELKIGADPETDFQILKDIKWMNFTEINQLKKEEIHQYFTK
jgi:8-oxo-dGTP diphosphatase